MGLLCWKRYEGGWPCGGLLEYLDSQKPLTQLSRACTHSERWNQGGLISKGLGFVDPTRPISIVYRLCACKRTRPRSIRHTSPPT